MSNRVEGERVFCYQCGNEWDRAHGGLQCPRCESEFVEILSPNARPTFDDPAEITSESPPRSPFESLRDHNPWNAPDPDEGDIRTIHFNSGGGGQGSFSFSRTYTFGGPRGHGYDPAADEVMRSFEQMVTGLLGGPARNRSFGGTININGRTTTFGSGAGDMGFGGAPDPLSMFFPGLARSGNGPRMGGPFDLLNALLDPRNASSGDAVYSQEAFDRIMSQLMEQNQQNGAPPASEELINDLPRKQVDSSMFGDDGKAECSICMDGVEIGTEVAMLPCNHWFHFECIESWLKEHDTCPHCRKPITPEDQRSNPRPSRASRRPSSVATPMPAEDTRNHPLSPREVRTQREQYYGRHREEPDQRSSSERRASRRSTDGQEASGGGGLSGWIRSRLPFS